MLEYVLAVVCHACGCIYRPLFIMQETIPVRLANGACPACKTPAKEDKNYAVKLEVVGFLHDIGRQIQEQG